MNQIVIRGARGHNLKNIDLVLPRERLIVITGVSGSGKSSLAFDTLFAEGRRRYIESISTRSRQFLHRLAAPPVDEISGLSPAIAVDQHGLSGNPRSTIGTITEIHDYLRLLYARLGTMYCPACNLPVAAHTIPEMSQEILSDWAQDSRLLILAPLSPVKEKELPKTLLKLRKEGFARIRLEGMIYELDPLPKIPRRPVFDIEVVVDRLLLDAGKVQRLSASLELAAKLGNGMVKTVNMSGGEKSFSELFRCTSCGRDYPKPSPSLFSFHHPVGACPSCRGLGSTGIASDIYSPAAYDKPTVSKSQTEVGHITSVVGPDQYRNSADGGVVSLSSVCPQCNGSRLNKISRSVRLCGAGIHELSRMPLPVLRHWISTLELSPTHEKIAEQPRKEILQRIATMQELGLSYLSLDRSATTLSGGESQRIRLSQQISARLSGVLYVLDEPSLGLHPRDHDKLLNILFRLRDEGNTVVVVEHDRETILKADFVVDIGPGAGEYGGEVLFSGSPGELLNCSTSLTGSYLSGRLKIPVPTRRQAFCNGAVSVIGATGHNLKNITARFPIGCITCVTGVSGSGKSTLIMHTLYRAMAQKLYRSLSVPENFERIDGIETIRRIILVDQAPLGRTPRSNPATYTGLFSLIRNLYAQLPESKARGYGSNRFSFNMKGGRCESCKGEGLQRIEMHFLPDIYVTCPVCSGSRFNAEALEIRFKGGSIADVLEMSVHEAAGVFENISPIRSKLQSLQEVGLGYIRLGQPATTLSGGEAQRVKLAAELGRRVTEPALYILDEPTTGLHFDDIQKLLHVLQRLADAGHTVIMIEHHPDVIKTADFVIDLGPEGGEEGGYIVAKGTPEDVAKVEGSHTGRYLRHVLQTSCE
ncbi:MAG: excinuclease ABC subunit UvrA [Syntrophobacteraceae bacterium]